MKSSSPYLRKKTILLTSKYIYINSNIRLNLEDEKIQRKNSFDNAKHLNILGKPQLSTLENKGDISSNEKIKNGKLNIRPGINHNIKTTVVDHHINKRAITAEAPHLKEQRSRTPNVVKTNSHVPLRTNNNIVNHYADKSSKPVRSLISSKPNNYATNQEKIHSNYHYNNSNSNNPHHISSTRPLSTNIKSRIHPIDSKLNENPSHRVMRNYSASKNNISNHTNTHAHVHKTNEIQPYNVHRNEYKSNNINKVETIGEKHNSNYNKSIDEHISPMRNNGVVKIIKPSYGTSSNSKDNTKPMTQPQIKRPLLNKKIGNQEFMMPNVKSTNNVSSNQISKTPIGINTGSNMNYNNYNPSNYYNSNKADAKTNSLINPHNALLREKPIVLKPKTIMRPSNTKLAVSGLYAASKGELPSSYRPGTSKQPSQSRIKQNMKDGLTEDKEEPRQQPITIRPISASKPRIIGIFK